MAQPQQDCCQEFQAKMLELLPTKKSWGDEEIWQAVTAELGNENERYCGIYICIECRQLYHADYSTNSDPDRDFCGFQCESAWLEKHPQAEYNGELND
jgi:hypothetical protein